MVSRDRLEFLRDRYKVGIEKAANSENSLIYRDLTEALEELLDRRKQRTSIPVMGSCQ
jgi:hypothetical protein